jgi:uncharacterized protein YbjT (DUF2867 family)
MKVILIGATGQVGYALAPALIEARHEVTVLVRDASRLPFSKSIRRVAVPEFDAEVFGRALRGVECAVYSVGLPEQFAFDTGVAWTATSDCRRFPRVEAARAANHSGEVHPMHLHGHHVVVLARNGVAAS